MTSLIATLACPLCSKELSESGNALRCENRHTFNKARQGYYSFAVGNKKFTGDTTEMIQHRNAFLEANGHYQFIVAELANLLNSEPQTCLDVACGTGYYAKQIIKQVAQTKIIGLDISQPAIKYAANVSKEFPDKFLGCTSDVWQTFPIKNNRIDTVFSIFGPKNSAEFARVLKPNGRLIIVTPASNHMIELREKLGLLNIQDKKQNNLIQKLPDFTCVETIKKHQNLALSHKAAHDEILMGPNGFHYDSTQLEKDLTESFKSKLINVTASVVFQIWEPK
ncbi:MAG: methyltransferase domain-containing protein [Micrococcaceae bacterium]